MSLILAGRRSRCHRRGARPGADRTDRRARCGSTCLAILAIVAPTDRSAALPVRGPCGGGCRGCRRPRSSTRRSSRSTSSRFWRGAPRSSWSVLLRDRFQAVAGLAVAEGVAAVVIRNDPNRGVADFVVASIIFGIVWTIAFARRPEVPRGRRGQGAGRARRAGTRGTGARRSRRGTRADRARAS